MKPGQAQFLAHVRHNRCCTGQSRRLPRQTSTISSAPSLYSWTLRLPRTTPRHYPSLMEGSSRKHLLRSRYLFIPHQRGRDRLIPHNPLILNGSSNSRRPARFLPASLLIPFYSLLRPASLLACPALAGWTTTTPPYRCPLRPFSSNHGTHRPIHPKQQEQPNATTIRDNGNTS